jgi:hypothetical protein
MDNYDRMVKTRAWAKIREAQTALFDLQMILEGADMNSEFAYRARVELGTVENQIRFHFKHLTSIAECEILEI